MTKIQQSVNQVPCLVFAKFEPIQIKRPLWLRIFIWGFSVLQQPILVGFVCSAASAAIALISLAALPPIVQGIVAQVFQLVSHLASKKDLSTASATGDFSIIRYVLSSQNL